MLLYILFILVVVVVYKRIFRTTNMQMLSLSWYFAQPSTFFLTWLRKGRIFSSFIHGLVIKAAAAAATEKKKKKKKTTMMNVTTVECSNEVSLLLDLPDLVLECVLERVSAAGLYSTGSVCRYLRERCSSDYFWEKHMKEKWGVLIGTAAYHQWRKSHIAVAAAASNTGNQKGRFFLASVWPSRDRSKATNDDRASLTAADSIMAFYLCLETGKFWFPAQVYNREVQNGHVGFMLSCYDAQVCYDFRTDTFKARYSARGGQTIEENIAWNRLRKPAVDTPAHLLHVSDCLTDLKPNDHIEIQWRRSKEFPNGWWYGVIGHLESCNGDKCNCQCQTSETVVLEFKQYAPGSQWRLVVINRKDHREVGNESDGFYGGIRKLCHEEEISTWKHLWTTSCTSASASVSDSTTQT